MKQPDVIRRIRTSFMVLILLWSLTASPVIAQGLPELPGLPALPALPDLPDPGQIGEDICNSAGGVCDWIRYALSLAEQLQGLMDEFHGEIAGMGDDLYVEATDWLNDSLSTLSMGVDVGVVENAFTNIEQSLKEGPSALRTALRTNIRTLTKSRLEAENAPKDSPDGRYNETVRTIPSVAAAEVVTALEQEEAALVKAESAGVNETSFKLGAVVQQNTAAADTATTILRPGGDADSLEDDVNTAVSTRAAVQALTEGLADTMRHDATFQSNLAETVKALSQQQVMTNWQLQLTVQSLIDERETEISSAQAEVEAEINNIYEESERVTGQFQGVITSGAGLLTPETATLNPAALGW